MPLCSHPASAQYSDRVRGTVTCTLCGDIVQDQQLELDPVFARGEKANARSLRSLGHFRPTRGVIGTRMPSARPSTEAARRGMLSIARQLDISDDMVEMAVALYKLAVGLNAVSGARPAILSAVLYAVCRRERTSHMIYDFSDVAGESPYEILSYMRNICEATHTELPVIDPSCMVHRFAEQMNLGPMTGPVVVCALKVLRAMRDDWIACGRRPMGVCVAAILVACYMFNIPRSPDEVCGFVRLTAGTIMKRLDEFASTTTAGLQSIDEYTKNESSLPPSFSSSQVRSNGMDVDAEMRKLSATYYELVSEAKISAPATPERCEKWRRFLVRHCEMENTVANEENLDLTKLSPQQQLRILGLPNAKPIDPEKVRESVRREEVKILLKQEHFDPVSASQSNSGVLQLPLQTQLDMPMQPMTAYYRKLMNHDPNVLGIRRDFDFSEMGDDPSQSPSIPPIAPGSVETMPESLTEVLYDSERRFALPWEFIILQDPALEDTTDLDLYLVLDNEERLRRRKVGEALYKEDWDLGRARTKEEIEKLEDFRTSRKRRREPIKEHATVQDALTRALRGRGAGSVNVSQIDELVPGLVSKFDGGTEDDWLNE
ncbi:transcription factor [Trypanosoma cruzi]|uniref:Putative transcription factor IIIb n=1 Tax=Trypanosoma cruzi TaxID=5693 RepID=A0A2V2VKY4_TRYCR|nr:TFIIB-related factor BRF1 [Trypanosoma cruzi]PBJ79266.1 transcription factor [Trypanosoma cruzi cruzi]PWU96356.1 putative transcription factor IIIb [Trypanosoma cruzi]RNF21661.1 transcription factor [Trypanosoma cruzi]